MHPPGSAGRWGDFDFCTPMVPRFANSKKLVSCSHVADASRVVTNSPLSRNLSPPHHATRCAAGGWSALHFSIGLLNKLLPGSVSRSAVGKDRTRNRAREVFYFPPKNPLSERRFWTKYAERRSSKAEISICFFRFGRDFFAVTFFRTGEGERAGRGV